MSTKH